MQRGRRRREKNSVEQGRRRKTNDDGGTTNVGDGTTNGDERRPTETNEGVSFEIVVHHGGKFVTVENIVYNGGYEHDWRINDADKWSFFEAVGIIKEDLGYKKEFVLWWKSEHEAYVGGYRAFRDDNDAKKVAEFALKYNCVIHLYVESLEDEHVEGNLVDDNTEADDDDDAKGVHFDDSEEERALGLNDELGDLSDEERTPRAGPSQQLGDNDDEDSLDEDFDPLNEALEEDYLSEELVSDDPDEENDDQQRYPVFNKAQLHKDFKFQVGMEFKSTEEFKRAILEHSVLNGKETRFLKNDKRRCRMVCKSSGKCDFLAYCSRVGDIYTFRIKTLEPKHTCGRVFNNSNANSKWVSKIVADRLASAEKVKISEVMTDIRRRYATGITVARAWRGIKIARDAVEGDAARQYSLLWDYSAELRRACIGNTCKINVDRIPPTLQPRFGSFYFCLDGCKKGFLAGCRPFIGVDGCHLKTKYGGCLLVAVGRDPNDQYYPLAFGVVESETKESWRWFLTLLLEDIGQERRWVFISDQQKVK